MIHRALLTHPLPSSLEDEIVHFGTLEEAVALARVMAQRFANPASIELCLVELMVNAIEHGNLGITYDEKTQLLSEGRWLAEIERRLALAPYQARYATLQYQARGELQTLTIYDQGSGFDWQPYTDIAEARVHHPNGRGIAIARAVSCAEITYHGNGSTVMLSAKRTTP